MAIVDSNLYWLLGDSRRFFFKGGVTLDEKCVLCFETQKRIELIKNCPNCRKSSRFFNEKL